MSTACARIALLSIHVCLSPDPCHERTIRIVDCPYQEKGPAGVSSIPYSIQIMIRKTHETSAASSPLLLFVAVYLSTSRRSSSSSSFDREFFWTPYHVRVSYRMSLPPNGPLEGVLRHLSQTRHWRSRQTQRKSDLWYTPGVSLRNFHAHLFHYLRGILRRHLRTHGG